MNPYWPKSPAFTTLDELRRYRDAMEVRYQYDVGPNHKVHAHTVGLLWLDDLERNFDRASEWFQISAELGYPLAYTETGLALLEAGKPKVARPLLTRDCDPTHTSASLSVALLCLAPNDDGALAMARDVLRSSGVPVDDLFQQFMEGPDPDDYYAIAALERLSPRLSRLPIDPDPYVDAERVFLDGCLRHILSRMADMLTRILPRQKLECDAKYLREWAETMRRVAASPYVDPDPMSYLF